MKLACFEHEKTHLNALEINFRFLIIHLLHIASQRKTKYKFSCHIHFKYGGD